MENGDEHGDEQKETDESHNEHEPEHEKEQEQEEAPNDEPTQSHVHESNGEPEYMIQSADDITNANTTKDEQVSFFRQMDSKHRHTQYC